MKRKAFIGVAVVALCVGLFLLVRDYWQPAADPLQKQFIKARHAEARRLAQSDTNPIPSKVWAFFRAAERNDYRSAALIYDKLAESEYAPRTNRPAVEKYWDDFKPMLGIRGKERSELDDLPLATPMWETKETLCLFRSADPKWIRRFGDEISASVSTNGILFTGTDAWRVIVLCVKESSSDRKPFVTIALNMLADGSYLDYLRQTCGGSVVIPTAQDSQNAFNEYMREAQRRMEESPNTNAPSAPFSRTPTAAIFEINSLLANRFVERNPVREFFLADAFRSERLLPFLEPCGPILRLHETPVEALGENAVLRGRVYWQKLVNELIGDWLRDETPIAEVCRFAEAIYLRNDLSRFKGDVSFVADVKSRERFARLRSSIGCVYFWQAMHASSPLEQQRMRVEADFAFRQALALCPSEGGAAWSYFTFLNEVSRPEDSLTVVRLWAASRPGDLSAQEQLRWLDQIKAKQPHDLMRH